MHLHSIFYILVFALVLFQQMRFYMQYIFPFYLGQELITLF